MSETIVASADYLLARRRLEAIELLRELMNPAFDELGLVHVRGLREQLAAVVGEQPAREPNPPRRGQLLVLLKLQAMVAGARLDPEMYPSLPLLQADLQVLLCSKPRVGDTEAQREAQRAAQREARRRLEEQRELRRAADERHEQLRFGPE